MAKQNKKHSALSIVFGILCVLLTGAAVALWFIPLNRPLDYGYNCLDHDTLFSYYSCMVPTVYQEFNEWGFSLMAGAGAGVLFPLVTLIIYLISKKKGGRITALVFSALSALPSAYAIYILLMIFLKSKEIGAFFDANLWLFIYFLAAYGVTVVLSIVGAILCGAQAKKLGKAAVPASPDDPESSFEEEPEIVEEPPVTETEEIPEEPVTEETPVEPVPEEAPVVEEPAQVEEPVVEEPVPAEEPVVEEPAPEAAPVVAAEKSAVAPVEETEPAVMSEAPVAGQIVCPYCGSAEPMQIGIDFYMCMACRMKYTCTADDILTVPVNDVTSIEESAPEMIPEAPVEETPVIPVVIPAPEAAAEPAPMETEAVTEEPVAPETPEEPIATAVMADVAPAEEPVVEEPAPVAEESASAMKEVNEKNAALEAENQRLREALAALQAAQAPAEKPIACPVCGATNPNRFADGYCVCSVCGNSFFTESGKKEAQNPAPVEEPTPAEEPVVEETPAEPIPEETPVEEPIPEETPVSKPETPAPAAKPASASHPVDEAKVKRLKQLYLEKKISKETFLRMLKQLSE